MKEVGKDTRRRGKKGTVVGGEKTEGLTYCTMNMEQVKENQESEEEKYVKSHKRQEHNPASKPSL